MARFTAAQIKENQEKAKQTADLADYIFDLYKEGEAVTPEQARQKIKAELDTNGVIYGFKPSRKMITNAINKIYTN